MNLRKTALDLAAAALAVLPGLLSAQRTFPGFNIGYPAPAGWNHAGREGPVDTWTEPRHGSAIIVFAGVFSPLGRALDEAAKILEAMPKQDLEVLEEPGARRVGTVDAMTAAVRMRGSNDTTYVVRFLARESPHGTNLVVVALALDARATVVKAAAEAILTGMTSAPPFPDRAAARALAGSWVRQESNMSSTGGYLTEEGWDLRADGTFSHWTNASATVPNAIVRPEQTREDGSWQAIGGTLVVTMGAGRTTIPLRREGASVLFVDGTQYLRR